MTDAILNPIFDTLHAKNVACWGCLGRKHPPPASSPCLINLLDRAPPLELVLPGQVLASAGIWTGWALGQVQPGTSGGSPWLIPAWALRLQEKLVLLVIPEEGEAPRFRPRPSPRHAIQDQPTNQAPRVQGTTLRSQQPNGELVCFLLQIEKGFLKRKYLNCQAEHSRLVSVAKRTPPPPRGHVKTHKM